MNRPFPVQAISIDQNSERMSYSQLLLTAPMEHKPTDFERVITGDESWFSLYYPRHSVWAAWPDDFLY
jgi:hypothetical protein